MRYIAHRGNVDGPCKSRENTPEAIWQALGAGYDVEVDVWRIDGHFFLGHDGPGKMEVPVKFFQDERVWCHAKNAEALAFLREFKNIRSFWHNTDRYTLTSYGEIWTYPGAQGVQGGIYVIPEALLADINVMDESVFADTIKAIIGPSAGICSDWVGPLHKLLG